MLGDRGVRDEYIEHVANARDRLRFLLHAWVVMPEHVHLVVLPRDGEIGPVLRGLKQGFGQRVLSAWKRSLDPRLKLASDAHGVLRFWQRGGGYDRNIRDIEELREKIEYIHTNPVRRGLVERAVDWRWSSAAAWAGLDAMIRPDPLP